MELLDLGVEIGKDHYNVGNTEYDIEVKGFYLYS
jgi:hypothetical protein